MPFLKFEHPFYAAGQSNAGVLPAVIQQYNIANDFSLDNTFSPDLDVSANTTNAALSPDNSKIYAIADQGATFYLYAINTSTMTAPAGGETFPYSIVRPSLQNFPYLAYSPDGSIVSITNYGNSENDATGNLTALFSPNTSNDVTTVNPSGNAVPMYSFTWGSFIN